MPDTPRDGNSESSRSPIRMMAEILKDKDLNAEDKQLLHDLAKTRFLHRRAMAYIALAGIFVFSGLQFLPVAVTVTVSPPEGGWDAAAAAAAATAAAEAVARPDVTWINTTLAAIVVSYYGASAVRPGS